MNHAETQANQSTHVRAFILLTIAAAVAFLPNLQRGIISGPDASYHLARMQTLYEALSQGIFPVKVHPSFVEYGYGTGFFYPNTLLYLPAVLMLCGLSLTAVYKIFVFLTLLAMVSGMYCMCRKIEVTESVALLTAVLYLFSCRAFYNLYERFALGETLGMAFVPLAVGGVYLYFAKDASPVPMIAGMTGLVLTHTITTLLTVCSCLCMVLILIPKARFFWKKVLGAALSAILVLMLTASYWIPMWQQFRAMRIKTASPWTTASEHVLPLTMVAGRQGYGIPVVAVVIFCIVLLVREVCSGTDRGEKLWTWLWQQEGTPFFVTGIVLTLLASFRPFFAALNAAGIRLIQFPTRIYGVGLVLLLFGVALTLSQVVTHPDGGRLAGLAERLRTGSLMPFAFVLTLSALCVFPVFRGELTPSDNVLQRVAAHDLGTLGAGEWLPLEMRMEDLTTPETAYDERGNAVPGKKEAGYSIFRFSADGESAYYILPMIYYRGYAAETTDGERLELTEDESGFLKVFTPQEMVDTPKEIIVWYEGTRELRLSYWITVGSLIGCAIVFLKKRLFH